MRAERVFMMIVALLIVALLIAASQQSMPLEASNWDTQTSSRDLTVWYLPLTLCLKDSQCPSYHYCNPVIHSCLQIIKLGSACKYAYECTTKNCCRDKCNNLCHPEGGTCLINDECKTGYCCGKTCVANQCKPIGFSCKLTADCQGGSACYFNKCIITGQPSGASCISLVNCSKGCRNGKCL